MDHTPGSSIRVAARRTGLSPHVIRVWERRYAAVVPQRSDTNRRLYTDEDIERLRLLSAATQAGHSIGQIAGLETAQLQDIVHQDAPGAVAPAGPPGQDATDVVARAMLAVRRLDAKSLEAELARGSVQLGRIRFLDDIIHPLIQQVGDEWHAGTLRIAEEHLATATIRSQLGRLLETDRAPDGAPAIVVTTPNGQQHEVGALIAATTASACGWRVVYLGPQLPPEEICNAAHRHAARAVGLSIVYPDNDPMLADQLQRLREGLGATIDLLIGGRAALAYAASLQQTEAMHIADMGHLRRYLTARVSDA